MLSNIVANGLAAPTALGPDPDAAAARLENTRGDNGISLFSKDLRDLIAQRLEGADSLQSRQASALTNETETGVGGDLRSHLQSLQSLLQDLKAVLEGKGLPPNGSELPSIATAATSLAPALDQILEQLQQAIGLLSTSEGAQLKLSVEAGQQLQQALDTALANIELNTDKLNGIGLNIGAFAVRLNANTTGLGIAGLASEGLSLNGAGGPRTDAAASLVVAISQLVTALQKGQRNGNLGGNFGANVAGASNGVIPALADSPGQQGAGLRPGSWVNGGLGSNLSSGLALDEMALTGSSLNGQGGNSLGLVKLDAHSSGGANGLGIGLGTGLGNPVLTASLNPSQTGPEAALGRSEWINLTLTEAGVKTLTSATGTANSSSAANIGSGFAGANAAQTFNTQLELPLGNAQWGNQVLQRVAWLTGHGIAAAEIHLNPPELGPMQVRVDQRQDSATVVFSSHHASTREAIEASLPRLRELFNEQGLDLLDVDIEDGEQESASSADSEAGEDSIDSQSAGQTTSLATGTDDISDTSASALASGSATITLHYGLIDAYA